MNESKLKYEELLAAQNDPGMLQTILSALRGQRSAMTPEQMALGAAAGRKRLPNDNVMSREEFMMRMNDGTLGQ